jgi:hypothetical protein
MSERRQAQLVTPSRTVSGGVPFCAQIPALLQRIHLIHSRYPIVAARRWTNPSPRRRLRDLGPAGAARVQKSTSVVFLFIDKKKQKNQTVTE